MNENVPSINLHSPGQNGHIPGPSPLAVHRADALPADRSVEATHEPLRGAPPIFDEEKRRQYCQLLRHGVAKGAAARLLGVAPRTVQLAVKSDPELADRGRQARLECHARAAAQVARAGDKNWRAAAWLLEQGKRRRGPGRPRKTPLPLSDPLARDQMKQLVRNVLLEVMPELRHEITAKHNTSPLAQAAGAAVDAFTADRQARLVALAAETKAIHQSVRLPDFDALWRRHLPGVPRNSAHPNAQQFPSHVPQLSTQTNTPQQLATITSAVAAPLVAQNPLN